MTSNQIRLKAAILLESRPDAWCQGHLRTKLPSGDYAYCMIGACCEVVGHYTAVSVATTRTTAIDARVAADAAVAPYVDIGYADVWNDAPGRTREEVIAALSNIKDKRP